MTRRREFHRVEKDTLARAAPDVVLEDVVDCLHPGPIRVRARVIKVVEDVPLLRVQAASDLVAIHLVVWHTVSSDGVVDHAGDRLVLLVVGQAGPLRAIHRTRGLGGDEHKAECEQKGWDAGPSHGHATEITSSGKQTDENQDRPRRGAAAQSMPNLT